MTQQTEQKIKYYAYRVISKDVPPNVTGIEYRGTVRWLSDSDLKFFNLKWYERIPELDVLDTIPVST